MPDLDAYRCHMNPFYKEAKKQKKQKQNPTIVIQ